MTVPAFLHDLRNLNSDDASLSLGVIATSREQNLRMVITLPERVDFDCWEIARSATLSQRIFWLVAILQALDLLSSPSISCRSGEIGIRTRLKIWRGQTHVGSSPTSGTKPLSILK